VLILILIMLPHCGHANHDEAGDGDITYVDADDGNDALIDLEL
jgi:hypothetical protein